VRSEACTSLAILGQAVPAALGQAVPAARQQIRACLKTIAEHDTSSQVRSDAQRAVQMIA
jgi:hypothetical protein